MAEVLDRKPIRSWLRERETYIPRKRLVDMFEGGLSFGFGIFRQPPVVPVLDKVSAEDAIEVVASSSWAKGIATGVCGAKYVGLTPDTPEYRKCVYNVSHKVAARVLGLTWTPPPAPPVRPPRRRRR